MRFGWYEGCGNERTKVNFLTQRYAKVSVRVRKVKAYRSRLLERLENEKILLLWYGAIVNSVYKLIRAIAITEGSLLLAEARWVLRQDEARKALP